MPLSTTNLEPGSIPSRQRSPPSTIGPFTYCAETITFLPKTIPKRPEPHSITTVKICLDHSSKIRLRLGLAQPKFFNRLQILQYKFPVVTDSNKVVEEFTDLLF